MKRALGIAAMWLALIALPWWLPMIGGYTALGLKGVDLRDRDDGI